jgi:hypothetical protein
MPVERASVKKLVAGMNSARAENKPAALEALLSKHLSAAERAAIVESERAACAVARQVWSETTIPRMSIRALREITPEMPEVAAVDMQFGSVGVRRWNVLLIQRREGSNCGSRRFAKSRVLNFGAKRPLVPPTCACRPGLRSPSAGRPPFRFAAPQSWGWSEPRTSMRAGDVARC